MRRLYGRTDSTRVGHFLIENALTLDQVEALAKKERISEVLEPVDHVFISCPCVYALEEDRKLVWNGNPLSEDRIELSAQAKKEGQWIRLYDDEEHFIGIYQYDSEQKRIKPVKMFLS